MPGPRFPKILPVHPGSRPAAERGTPLLADHTDHSTNEQPEPQAQPEESSGSVAAPPAPTAPRSATKPQRPAVDHLPPWKVLLHNDDVNSFDRVIASIVQLTPLDFTRAEVVTREANDDGVALLLVTHKERAELYQDQFTSKGLTVTIEPES